MNRERFSNGRKGRFGGFINLLGMALVLYWLSRMQLERRMRQLVAGIRNSESRLVRLQDGAMGLYSRYVLPRMLDFACRNKDVSELRKQVLPPATGIVVEVGIGSALNLPYYSPRIEHLYGIDLSPELLQMARRKTEHVPFPVTLLNQTAEKFPMEDHSVDTVVMTFVLCSIADGLTVLREAKRVLKRGGRLIFLEHGLSPEPKIQSWQNRLTPTWKRIGGGCCLNKKVDALISSGGFAIRELQNCYLPGPKPMTYVYRGFAEPE